LHWDFRLLNAQFQQFLIFDIPGSLASPPPSDEALVFGLRDLAKFSHAPVARLSLNEKIKNLAIPNHFC
jgi:hypothetical protein